MKLSEIIPQLEAKIAEQSAALALSAEQAALVPSLVADKEALTTAVAEQTALVETLTAAKAALEADKEALALQVATMQAEAQAAEEKALELVANVGLKAPLKVEAPGEEKQTAEAIRAKYMELQASSPAEAGRYFAEHRSTILNGFVSE